MKLPPEFASDRESKVCLQVEQISLWSKYLPPLKLLLLVALGYGNHYDHNRLLASEHAKHMCCTGLKALLSFWVNVNNLYLL